MLSSQVESGPAKLPSTDQQALTFNHPTMATSSLQRNDWVAISNVQADESTSESESDLTLEEEVTKCFQILAGRFINVIA